MVYTGIMVEVKWYFYFYVHEGKYYLSVTFMVYVRKIGLKLASIFYEIYCKFFAL